MATQLIVNLTVVPLMKMGSAGMGAMDILASSLINPEKGIGLKNSEDKEPVLEITVSEIEEIASFLALVTNEATEVGNMTVVIDSVMMATTGSKKLIKQSVLQVQSYKNTIANLKQLCQAEMTMRPEMDDWIAKFESQPTLLVLQEGLSRVPAWQDKLRGGLHCPMSSPFQELQHQKFGLFTCTVEA